MVLYVIVFLVFIFFWKYESKLKSTQVCKGEEHNLILPLQEIYPWVLTIKLKEFELVEEF